MDVFLFHTTLSKSRPKLLAVVVVVIVVAAAIVAVVVPSNMIPVVSGSQTHQLTKVFK
jgi:hypothetical protein